MKSTLSKMFDAIESAEEKAYRKRCNFACPICGEDLHKQAESGAYDWSVGIPDETGAFCENCQKDVWFRLEWNHVLYSARLVEYPEPEQ